MSETAKNNESTKSTAAKTATRSASSGARAAGAAGTKASSAANSAKSAAAEGKDQATGSVLALRSKAKAGGEMLSTIPGKSVQVASTAWTVVRKRKQIAACAGGGALAALAGAYSLGRVAARRGQGPFTRVTGGRF
ncbi:hypothetical protein AB0M94_01870 [Streptomyces xanthochromogenes]|uniref:Uncharacterized protein n=1 Tax=Streptomyces xanthochromogenes TaxID=67384 RepID=A0ABQ2ZKL4_9ACTN|nr:MULTISPECIES: hypothetical protein [Streptomyces]MYV92468.1 hypothetical protein [Streptomyces sp. SID1034]GGY16138.1 hypothetical protein GCM10010326_05050 [Streptomyces xanthochromogenes]